MARGERQSISKLKESQVVNIYKSKAKISTIAKKYGVSYHTIVDIRRGRNWGWLTSKIIQKELF